MINIHNIITNKLGIDKAIFYTLLGRGLQIFTALFTIIFIARYLSSEEQGYYYTFGSIVAIQVFFELGLTGIITQFVAHEASHLKISDKGELIGDKIYKSRLSSLLRFCLKWYFIFAVLLLIILTVIGFIFFSKYDISKFDINWQLPWILLAIGTAFNLLLAPIISFIEGLGKVKEVAQIRLVQQIIHPIVIWGGLIIGSKLFVSGADAILRVLIIAIIIVKSPFYRILKNIWSSIDLDKISYRKEIFPYQWRIALSWISGYFIFQLFNPVLFATDGAKVAGQMGMTMAALNGIQALTLSWINTKVPLMSGLIAQKKYSELDGIFQRTMKQMLLIGISGLLFFILLIYIIQVNNIHIGNIDIGDRFLPVIPVVLMAWSVFTVFPVSAWGTYLRCHKREPLMWNSIIIGLLCCFSTLGVGGKYGLWGIVVGFSVIRLISLIWVFNIYKKKKMEWHGK